MILDSIRRFSLAHITSAFFDWLFGVFFPTIWAVNTVCLSQVHGCALLSLTGSLCLQVSLGLVLSNLPAWSVPWAIGHMPSSIHVLSHFAKLELMWFTEVTWSGGVGPAQSSAVGPGDILYHFISHMYWGCSWCIHIQPDFLVFLKTIGAIIYLSVCFFSVLIEINLLHSFQLRTLADTIRIKCQFECN